MFDDLEKGTYKFSDAQRIEQQTVVNMCVSNVMIKLSASLVARNHLGKTQANKTLLVPFV